MASPKGFILYRIWYGNRLAYLGRTKQPLQARIHGHMFAAPMHKVIDIHNVTRIDYTTLKTAADMYLYEIYFINLWKPPLNVDDKTKDDLTITLPALEWTEFVPVNWERWKEELKVQDMIKWNRNRNRKIMQETLEVEEGWW